MIVLRFGTSGRLARVCQAATRMVHAELPVVAVNRSEAFRCEGDAREFATLQRVMEAYPDESVLVLDASVDHTSPEALVAHESFKRNCIATLAQNGLLWRCVGFSSGIIAFDAHHIRPSATHMLEYRRQKLLQLDLLGTLKCPVFAPQLFTLIGPRTYATQSAAWAHVLRARIDRSIDLVLNEPHYRKAWASEFEVLRWLVRFLAADRPEVVTGPLVQGAFTLHQIAQGKQLPMPAVDYVVGSGEGWLCGDYVPTTLMTESTDINLELLRAVAES